MTPDISAIAQKWARECHLEPLRYLPINSAIPQAITAAILEATASLRAQLEEIKAQVDRMPSATGMSPTRDYAGIRPAIADLQACYADAAKARNGQYSYTDIWKKLKAAEGERDVALARQERLITACENSIRALKPFIVAAEDWTETQKRMQVTAPLAQVLHELETHLAPESPLNGKEGK